jgi:16S rRNA (guanine(966)-N(2))-methyltransferase RsmD
MRIISGIYKGRNLKSPGSSLKVRPTTDRGKETLFNVLFNYIEIEDVVVADLFCGTGGIGIEFLSRGAGFCYFVDSDISTVKKNIELLSLCERFKLHRADVLKFLTNGEEYFNETGLPDVVFADPPYSYKNYEKLIDTVNKLNVLFILEHSGTLPETAWDSKKVLHKKTGIVEFTFFDFK